MLIGTLSILGGCARQPARATDLSVFQAVVEAVRSHAHRSVVFSDPPQARRPVWLDVESFVRGAENGLAADVTERDVLAGDSGPATRREREDRHPLRRQGGACSVRGDGRFDTPDDIVTTRTKGTKMDWPS